MFCKRCMIVMETGTTYERKKESNGNGKIEHKRFCQCPRCKDRVYNNSSNFQETLSKMLHQQ